MTLTVVSAQALEDFCGSMLYGLYLPTVFLAVRGLVLDNDRRILQWPRRSVQGVMLVCVLILWASISVNLALGVLRSQQALSQLLQPTPSAMAPSPVSNLLKIVKGATTLIVLVISDSILIYRCWAVFNRRSLVIVIPLLLLVAEIGVCVSIIYFDSTVHEKTVVDSRTLEGLILATCTIPLSLNGLTTSLIVWRIRQADREMARFQDNLPNRVTFQKINRVIIESGLLNLVTMVFEFVTYMAKSNVFYIATSVGMMVGGIAFNLLVIRTHNRVDSENEPASVVTHSLRFIAPTISAGRSTV